jgi:RNA polymerase sigma-70 factor (ECF subfamily)
VAAKPTREGATGEDPIARLHALLLRAARFEVAPAAPDAAASVRRRPRRHRQPLHDLGLQVRPARGGGEAAQAGLAGREVPLEPEGWGLFSSAGLEPDAEAEQSELLETLPNAIARVLTPHQRNVFVALALNGVPIDVLAERLNSNRGALYKTLHDARRKLRKHLQERGLALDNWLEEKR